MSIQQSICQPIQKAICAPVDGVASAIRQLLGLLTWDSTGKLIPGDWENGHTYDRLIADHEGIRRNHTADTLPVGGGRVVKNLLASESTEDFTNVAWGKDNVTSTIDTITSTTGSTFARAFQVKNDVLGEHVASVEIKNISMTQQASIRIRYGDGVNTIQNITLTDEWQRFAVADSSGTHIQIQLHIFLNPNGPSGVANNGEAIQVRRAQIQNKTDATDCTVPDEYQLVDATHDGIGIYNCANGNTVDGNGVVSYTKGADFDPAPYIVHEPASTNEFLNSDAPVTRDVSVTVGTWTVSGWEGTGTVTTTANTATITGGGVASDGSPNTIEVTGAGTITCTVAGSLVYVNVENLPFATSPIVTAGASAIRDVTQVRYPYSTAIFNQDSGFAYTDLTPEQAQSVLSAIDEGILSIADSATNLLFVDSGNLQSTDGTNTAAVDPNYAADTKIRFLVYWDKVGDVLGVGYRTLPGGTFTWATEQSFDDAFTSGSWFNLFYGNAHVWKMHDMGVFNKHQDQTYYEANY